MTSLFLIREMMSEELQEDISTNAILKKIDSCWDTKVAVSTIKNVFTVFYFDI